MSRRLGALFALVAAAALPALAVAQPKDAQPEVRSTRAQEGGFLIERDDVTIQPHAPVKVKQIQVDNRLGDVTVVGHDEPAVVLHVVKRGPDGETLDRLKVNLNADPDGTITIGTALLAGPEAAPLPARSIRVDVTIEMPRGAHIDVKAWNGKIAVTGVRAGAKLVAHEADIAVTDVAGEVSTGATRGSQKLIGVRGNVTTEHTFGHVALESVSGDVLAASVHEGGVVATRIRSKSVKLRTTFGDIHFTGEVLAGGVYDLAAYQGDVIVEVVPSRASGKGKGKAGKPPRLEVDAWAKEGKIDASAAIGAPDKGRLRGSFGAGKGKPAELRLTSAVGDVRFGIVND